MKSFPSLQSVLAAWGVLTAVAYVAYVIYLRGQPPDDLVMASTLSFQAAIGLIAVGLPAVVFLFLVLFIGAIAKRWLVEAESPVKERKHAA